MKVLIKIIKFILNYGINKKIKKYKYIHLMFNDKFNKPFVDFLNKNFEYKEHLVLCKKWFQEFPFPTGKNVFKIRSFVGLDFSKCEKIICHSLFDKELVDYLYEHQNILKEKAYWTVFGGDLYNAPRDKKNDFVRSNFKGYVTGGDRAYLQRKYDVLNKNFISAPYIFPITKKMLDNIKKDTHDFIKIQINNSCDFSTLEMLDILLKYKKENIKITTILSYGKLEYKKKIIQKGKNIFGDKFEYVDKFMPPEEYARYLSNIDILILNQNRQQGVGNTYASLYLGNKVFISKKISTFEDFNNSGIKIYATEDIKDLSFEDFVKNDYKEKTKNIMEREIYNEFYIVQKWNNIFGN